MTDPSTTAHATHPPAAIVVLLLTIVLTGFLLALGTWQVQRLFWKLDLIERVEARAHAAPVDAPAAREWPALADPAEYEYRRVKLSGTFLNDKEVQSIRSAISAPATG